MSGGVTPVGIDVFGGFAMGVSFTAMLVLFATPSPTWVERANLATLAPPLPDPPKCNRIVDTVAADDLDRQMRLLGCERGDVVCCADEGCACWSPTSDIDECPSVVFEVPCP